MGSMTWPTGSPLRWGCVDARFRFVDQALGPARRSSAAVDGRAMSSCYRPIADPVVGPMTLLFESDEMGHPEWLTEFELSGSGDRHCVAP